MHPKQLERLINKINQLPSIYEKYLVIEEHIINDVKLNGKIIKKGDLWGSDFAYGEFKFTARGIEKDKSYYLFSVTGGVEHLISVNGKKIGLSDFVENATDDIFRIHKYVLLDGIKNGDEITVEAYYSHPIPGTFPYHTKATFALNGLYEKRPFDHISLCVLDEELNELILELKDLAAEYKNSKNFVQTKKLADLYVMLFKVLSLKDASPSKESVNDALKIIKENFTAAITAKPYVGIIGHSHLDTAWLWTIEETRHKLLRTVSNAVQLMKKYKDYKFLISSVIYLEWIKEMDESLWQDVVALVKSQQLEVEGGSMLEFDSNLSGAEAICRHFIKGKRFLRENFDYEARVFFLPDTFGYAASLPGILKGVGIDYFLTTKLSWNDTFTFPYDTFSWTGIDGNRVFVHFNSIHSWVNPEDIYKRLNSVIDKNNTTSVLMTYGFGDGGGGPSLDMVKEALKMEKEFTSCDVSHTLVTSFMDNINKENLPKYYGELYLELHRGTFTVIHNIKKYHKLLEVLLHDLEEIAVLTGDKEKINLINELYDVLMLNEFHDILPGTCINEVNNKAINDLKNSCNTILSTLGNKYYFNPLFTSRTAYLNADEGQEYLDFDGLIHHIAYYKFDSTAFGKKQSNPSSLNIQDNLIKNKYFELQLENGEITYLLYNGKNLVNTLFNEIRYAENIPYIYDNWDIDSDYKLKEKKASLVSQEVISQGDEAIIIRTVKRILNSTLTTDMFIYNDSDIIEFKNKLKINDDHLLIRSYFDTTIFSRSYASDIQFGHILRNAYLNDERDIAKFEVCSHKWLDLSEKSYGVSILKKDLYGTSVDENVMGLTLYKGGTHPDNENSFGTFYFEYAIYPHTGGVSMDVINKGYEYNVMPVKVDKKFKNNLIKDLDLDTVVIETLKFGEDDGIVLRMYESLGKTSTAKIKLFTPKEVLITNILEDELLNLGVMSEINLEFKPFEIKTIKLKDLC